MHDIIGKMDPDAAALAEFAGGNENYKSFLKLVPGAKESAPELTAVQLKPFAGSLVAAPQQAAGKAAAAASAAAAEAAIRTDADVYEEVERDAGRRVRGEFEDQGEVEELNVDGTTVLGGRMNAPNSPGRLAVDNFVEEEDEDEEGEEDGGGYLTMVQGAGRGAASAAAPELEPEPEVGSSDADEGDGLLALVEERASVEGSLWGPAEELGSEGLEWAPDALPGAPAADSGDVGKLVQDVRGTAEAVDDRDSADVDEESSQPVDGEAAGRQAALDALFEPERPAATAPAPSPAAAAAASSPAAGTDEPVGEEEQGPDAWEDKVEAFSLDEDFDYDAVKLTVKVDIEAEKKAWAAAQQAKQV